MRHRTSSDAGNDRVESPTDVDRQLTARYSPRILEPRWRPLRRIGRSASNPEERFVRRQRALAKCARAAAGLRTRGSTDALAHGRHKTPPRTPPAVSGGVRFRIGSGSSESLERYQRATRKLQRAKVVGLTIL